MDRSYCCLGLMSGTSLDGLDIALCNLQLNGGKWSYSFIKTQTIEYSDEWSVRLRGALKLKGHALLHLHRDYGRWIGEQVNAFLYGLPTTVNLIASHGHTLFHEPEQQFNFQLGDGAQIAATTGIVTVCDFRSLDICLGGQGAPLVPVGDQLLFEEYGACVNLGGFANVSCALKHQRVAWDICAVNFVLNRLMGRIHLPFDKDGVLGQSGDIIPDLLVKLQNLSYYSKGYPKSLGQEWVEEAVWPLISSFMDFPLKDVLRTYYEHVARIIGSDLEMLSNGRVLFTGGGARNTFLMDRIRKHTSHEVLIGDDDLVNYKEALVFALLGVLRLEGEVNSLASVTGASKDCSSGSIYTI